MSKTYPLAFAAGQIYGDTVEPEVWTEYFLTAPDSAIVKGSLFKLQSGRMSSHPGRTGVWGISSRLAVQSDVLDPHIRYLIARLGLPRPDLPGRLFNAGAGFRIFCFWENDPGDRVAAISPELQDIIASSGGVIEIDEYPQKALPSGSGPGDDM